MTTLKLTLESGQTITHMFNTSMRGMCEKLSNTPLLDNVQRIEMERT